MILEFSVENFRSFRERQTFSMIPDEGRHDGTEHLLEIGDKYKLLPAAVIYGANASGKSNFIKALQSLQSLLIFDNFKWKSPPGSRPEYNPFLFNVQTANAPTTYTLDFLLDEIRYTYSLTFLRAQIVAESLFFYPQGREAKLFVRKDQVFEFGDYLKGQRHVVAELTRPDQLFLAKGAYNNISQLIPVIKYFEESLLFKPLEEKPSEYTYYYNIVAERLFNASKDDQFLQNFKLLFKSFDTGILDFKVKESTFRNFEREDQEFDVLTEHTTFNTSGVQEGTITLEFESESKGTQQLFVLGGLLLQTLMQGGVIVIDEFERSLHPLISSYLINLFHDPRINTKGAQLIIATHDTNLLSSNAFRRDQIWIVEKDQTGASEMFSLADVNGILKDAPYEKWYLSGRMGGIPAIQSLDFQLNFEAHEAQ
jgi:AAA15 family ATPase/GTPase